MEYEYPNAYEISELSLLLHQASFRAGEDRPPRKVDQELMRQASDMLKIWAEKFSENE